MLAFGAPAAAIACIPNHRFPIYADGSLGGCKYCALDGSRCELCWPGYGLTSAGECVRETCVDCPGDPSRCSQCVDGYFPNADGVCELCAPGCAVCAPDSPQLCRLCDAQRAFQLDLDTQTCILCDNPACMACPDAPNECLECSSQAAALAPHPVEVPPAALEPVNGTCVPCPAGCADCTSPDYCSLCSAEGHFSSPDAGACLPCSDPRLRQLQ
ncbi:hypothetical protein CHLNCDRAFT_141081 [Chlorella variabilis]|uniref:TNFR-Cys domain-containing protein n=1 Tax=Chlorella variabilis TaxID=554065 RepID=E1ZS44_CHLVA|nr:hypothetical protein CHLNCDRAFT_141081 [Chlorella variabilis]EFN51322.1 hypothetical protein CHLNCDRAFT_141081 [Chlorella variabilis]|eukprot:XP_005843424.1 hypothetical protein CHLNCDRAFT_141081 [Chlorella variabilis]